MYILVAFAVCFVYGGGVSYVIALANKIGILGDVSYLSQWTSINARYGWIIPAALVLMIVYVRLQKHSLK